MKEKTTSLEGPLERNGLSKKAKLLAVVHIYEEPEDWNSYHAVSNKNPLKHRVIVGSGKLPSGITKVPEIDSLAHELGHLVQNIYQTKSRKSDPRYTVPNFRETTTLFGLSAKNKKKMLNSETEAWEIAEKMLPIDQKAKEYSLRSYREATLNEGSFRELHMSIDKLFNLDFISKGETNK